MVLAGFFDVAWQRLKRLLLANDANTSRRVKRVPQRGFSLAQHAFARLRPAPLLACADRLLSDDVHLVTIQYSMS